MRVAKILVCLLLMIIPINSTSLADTIAISVYTVDGSPASGMIVYLLPLDGQKIETAQSKPLVVHQAKKKFAPYLSVLKKGMALSFVNDDNITHQIYSTSSANRFSFRIASNVQKTVKPLMSTGKVLMGCNIHDWMSGYLLVVDTPLYSKTDDSGSVTFDVAEKGNYQLSIWHPQLLVENQTVSQKINSDQRNKFQVKLSNRIVEIPDQENSESFDFLDDY